MHASSKNRRSTRRLFAFILPACLACVLAGCVCDGTERSFREIDQKYAESGWTAFTFVPIVGWFYLPFHIAQKDADYQRLLLRKPATDPYEAIRWTNRMNYIYAPDWRRAKR